MMGKKLPKTFTCAAEFTLAVLGGKWKTFILSFLKERPFRYSELRTLMPDLSDKMLTERLRELVGTGLVARKLQGRNSTVYSLTEKGLSLHPLLSELHGWGEAQALAFGVKVDSPFSRLGKKSRSRFRDNPRGRCCGEPEEVL